MIVNRVVEVQRLESINIRRRLRIVNVKINVRVKEVIGIERVSNVESRVVDKINQVTFGVENSVFLTKHE